METHHIIALWIGLILMLVLMYVIIEIILQKLSVLIDLSQIHGHLEILDSDSTYLCTIICYYIKISHTPLT